MSSKCLVLEHVHNQTHHMHIRSGLVETHTHKDTYAYSSIQIVVCCGRLDVNNSCNIQEYCRCISEEEEDARSARVQNASGPPFALEKLESMHACMLILFLARRGTPSTRVFRASPTQTCHFSGLKAGQNMSLSIQAFKRIAGPYRRAIFLQQPHLTQNTKT